MTNYPKLEKEKIEDVQEALLHWWINSIFKQSKRNFFWRSWILNLQEETIEFEGNSLHRDYAIFCVETVLQLTRAINVEIYFKAFFTYFHSFQDLYSADKEMLIKIITPLGRVSQNFRNLVDRTQIILEKFGGRVPKDKELIRSMMKTAKRKRHIYFVEAVALYTHGIFSAPVDVNVERIYIRLFNITRKKYGVQDDLEFCEFAKRVVPVESPIEFNLGLLDLGALICNPRKPKCVECPLKSICMYYDFDTTLETD